MKSVTSLSKRVRVSLAVLTALATLPLGSAFHSADAKPKSGAPAYGYRAKSAAKVQKRQDKRNRRDDKRNRRDDKRDDKREARRDRRNDRNTARVNSRNDRFDDRRNSDSDNRDYVLRYRTRINSAGDRVRQYFRVYNNR